MLGSPDANCGALHVQVLLGTSWGSKTAHYRQFSLTSVGRVYRQARKHHGWLVVSEQNRTRTGPKPRVYVVVIVRERVVGHRRHKQCLSSHGATLDVLGHHPATRWPQHKRPAPLTPIHLADRPTDQQTNSWNQHPQQATNPTPPHTDAKTQTPPSRYDNPSRHDDSPPVSRAGSWSVLGRPQTPRTSERQMRSGRAHVVQN